MRASRVVEVVAVLSVLLGPWPATTLAQTPSSPSAATAPGPSVGQRVESGLGGAARELEGGAGGAARGAVQEILGWLHRTDTTAVQGGRLAQQKGSSSLVKKLGSKLVADHAAIEREVTALAAARGVHLPAIGTGGPSAASRGLASLTGLSGSAFDSGFLRWVAQRQGRQAVQARSAQASAQQAGEPALAALLGKLAPQLESHARSARAAATTGSQPRQARSASSP